MPVQEMFRVGYLPSSWGISWQSTAIDVEIPPPMLLLKAAAIARPSTKLWSESPTITIHATLLTPENTEQNFTAEHIYDIRT